MKYTFYLIICILFSTNVANSQQFKPPICGNPAMMTSTCLESCIICDIDGFVGRNDSNITGEAPPGFCTSVVHHMQWIGFIAGTTDLTITVTPTNCKLTHGLEVGIYESLDCMNFELVSNCNTDIRPNITAKFSNTKPLVIGQHYYFVMDGNNNDVCDYLIKVMEGSTKVSPLDTMPQVQIPSDICLGESIDCSVTPLFGAIIYDWIVDGQYVSQGLNFTKTFANSGTYTICSEASNVCDTSPRNCKKVTVHEPVKMSQSDTLCYGKYAVYNNDTLKSTGVYTLPFQSVYGCDSIIELTLTIQDKVTDSLHVIICQGDTLMFNGSLYTMMGQYSSIVPHENACDTYFDVNVTAIDCNITMSAIPTSTTCYDTSDGRLEFRALSGTPPLHYEIINLLSNDQKNVGTISQLNAVTTIGNLPYGFYQIFINDDFGNEIVEHVEITRPSSISKTTSLSDYSGYNISCFGENNGKIDMTISGGTPPYNITSSGGNVINSSIQNLSVGTYTISITDSHSCPYVFEEEIIGPEPLGITAVFNQIDCNYPNNGSIDPITAVGGVPPYSFALNQGGFSSTQSYSGLSAGIYTIFAKDDNGCISTFQDTLDGVIIPSIFNPDSIVNINLGDEIQVNIGVSPNNSEVIWSPNENISCIDCLDPVLFPYFNTTYTITATSDDGCMTRSEVIVNVEKTNSFIISNIYTPNEDRVNDYIRYYAGKDVKEILYLKIYDRWGNLVFQKENLEIGLIDQDWNTTFNGQPLSQGVYAWIALVAYLDDRIVLNKGDLQIIR